MSKSSHFRNDDTGDSRIDDLLKHRKIKTIDRTKEKRLQRMLKTHNVDELIEEEKVLEEDVNFDDQNREDWLNYLKTQEQQNAKLHNKE